LKTLMDMTAAAPDATQQARDLVAEMARIESLYSPVALSITQLALSGQHEAAITKLDDDCRPLLSSLIGTTQAYAQLARDRQQQVIREYQAQYQTQVMMLVSFSAGAVLLAILASWWITRAIVRPIQTAVGIAQTVASGDLTSHFNVEGKDETGDLLRALRGMNDHLLQTVGSVRGISNSIGTAAQEIAAGNADLSQRTEEQAASLGETASSMEQLTATVMQNSANAQQASTLATKASDVANNGSLVVSRVVDTIRAIQDSSSKIADITGIIEGIAFQTNILALNAAVEAARAGEQGRGFAVVASEVRSLAQRSSSAAKEIKTLISASVQKIQDGAALAGEAGTTMTDVTHAVRSVTDLIAQIASASTEQSHGIEQVNIAIAQMDEVTQQNAALVEEAAASSQALDDQGRHLTEAVSRFVLDAHEGRAPSSGFARGARTHGGSSRALSPVSA